MLCTKCKKPPHGRAHFFAEKLGKSYNMVNAYAQNRQQPRLETLMEIADILDVDVKELIISNKQN